MWGPWLQRWMQMFSREGRKGKFVFINTAIPCPLPIWRGREKRSVNKNQVNMCNSQSNDLIKQEKWRRPAVLLMFLAKISKSLCRLYKLLALQQLFNGISFLYVIWALV